LNKESKAIPDVILPEGYDGKILLVLIQGDGFKNRIVLRSGDLWHRDILRNTETEIRNLGFHHLRCRELGGAHLRFEPNGSITIYGTSQQYGACDKIYAVKLVKKKYPDYKVQME
jgi:hypothetical protein